jgi:radical SAM superfamily enzyme YgiQ (UPF0313 family)
MNILFANPEVPDTFWSFRHALKFISLTAPFPPLGLLTVAALLPPEWNKRLVDLNIENLSDDDIRWADYVFLGSMSVQERSARDILARSQQLSRPVVAGGPLFTARPDEFPEVDHLVLNEAELTLPRFLEDLSRGVPERRYTSTQWADVTKTPVPLWDLANIRKYSSMNVQFSRGCPYDCEFCDITVLYGRAPRTKTTDQLIREFDSLKHRGWSGDVFLVDDNFIGNKPLLKQDLLPALIQWRKKQKHPFTLNTEVSLNLADDEELMDLMVQAGFSHVFVGVESPNEESLLECKKVPNYRRDLLASVHRIQTKGLQVQGGFILGFDNDPESIFERMIAFIQESGIVTAMVGLLNAPVGTRLFKRMSEQGRLLNTMSGDNTDFSMNFVPKMDMDALLKGYRTVLETIYAPKHYYARVKKYLRTYRRRKDVSGRIRLIHLKALAKSVVLLGVVGKERFQYWKLISWSLCTRPSTFPTAIVLAIYGFHFRKIVEQYVVS